MQATHKDDRKTGAYEKLLNMSNNITKYLIQKKYPIVRKFILIM